MYLAGDIGGTKTLLGLFAPAAERPTAVEVGEFVTLEYDGLEAIVREFLRAQNVSPRQIEVACFGVAGAVTDNVARLTNVPWLVDIRAVAERSGLRALPAAERPRGARLRDSGARARRARSPAAGRRRRRRQRGGDRRRHRPRRGAAAQRRRPLRAGRLRGRPRRLRAAHAARAADGRGADEGLRSRQRRARRVGAGPGQHLPVHARLRSGPARPSRRAPSCPRKLCAGVGQVRDPADLPARISQSALERRCPLCVEALEIFVDAYGSEAGNLALRYVATGGVYVGGGIAPKIMPAMESGQFLDAFRAKGR